MNSVSATPRCCVFGQGSSTLYAFLEASTPSFTPALGRHLSVPVHPLRLDVSSRIVRSVPDLAFVFTEQSAAHIVGLDLEDPALGVDVHVELVGDDHALELGLVLEPEVGHRLSARQPARH